VPSIRVVNENGEVEEREFRPQDSVVIKHEDSDVDFRPDIVKRLEFDHQGGMSRIKTVCGETENRRESNDGPEITVEGIVSEDQLPTLKGIHDGQEIILISEIESGSVVVERVTVEQNSDIVEYIPEGSNESKMAFPFQLQLQTPEA